MGEGPPAGGAMDLTGGDGSGGTGAPDGGNATGAPAGQGPPPTPHQDPGNPGG
ncbi:hypothetical protein ACFXP3_06455 [Streptomyces sp. NPDC059096]|uniref:hypothetical protein n=1 Tax=Streptomyces sp. NPDC059096 TaxID=3346727 RepID=UPI0036C31C16